MKGRVAASILVLASASCSGDPSSGIRTTERDSAGITIVENYGVPSLGEGGWAVAPAPSLAIGTAYGEEVYALDDVRGAHRSQDGTIAVVNSRTDEVRVFDSAGAHLRSFGREGQGPGEFHSMALAGVVGRDTLTIVDVGNDRFTMVHPVHGFVRQSVVSDDVVRYLYTQGVFSDGSVVFLETFDDAAAEGMSEGLNRGEAFFRSANPDGSLGTDFGRIKGMELELEARVNQDGEPWTRHIRVPFGKQPFGAVGGDRLYLSESDEFEIQIRHQSGELARIVRLDQETRQFTPRHHQLYVEEVVARSSTEESRRRLRRVLEEQPHPGEFPAHDRMVVDGLGYLWILEVRIPGEGEPAWLVFDPDGKLQARVMTPEGVEILEIGPDYILGVSEDELDVQYVQLFDLTRAQGEG